MTTNGTPSGSDRSLPNIHRVVTIASRRVRRVNALRRASLVGATVAGVAFVLVIVARVTPALGLPPGSQAWPWITVAAAAAVALAALIAYFAPRTQLADAIEVDQRLGLRDRLSSALSLAREDAPFAVAAVRDGERTASDRGLPAKVAKAFAVEWPRTWWVAPVLALAAFMAAWLMPQMDLWSRSNGVEAEDVQLARDDAAREIGAVVKQIEENPLLAEALAAEVDKAGADFSGDKPTAPEEIRREALKKLTELSEKLDELVNDEKAQSLEALKDQLASLNLPEAPEAAKFAEALKRGDFGKANEALKALQQALEKGTLTPEQREALAEALEKMAEELAKSEAERKAIEDALREAGLDPQLASNPEALKNALENSQKLSESQKQALEKALQCQNGAAQMRKELAQQMSQMASQCKGGKPGDGGKPGAGGQLGEMLSDLEMSQVMLNQAKAAQGACKGGKASLCQGSGGCGGGFANGMTNSGGIGGGARPEMRTATKSKIEQAQGKKDGADVIAREFIEGAPIVGESTAVLRRIELNASAVAEEGSDDDPIPSHLTDVHKHYFGELKKKIDARRAGTSSAEKSDAKSGSTNGEPSSEKSGGKSGAKSDESGAR